MNESKTNSRWFTIASWIITGLIVAGLLGFAIWTIQSRASAAPVLSAEPTATSEAPAPANTGGAELPAVQTESEIDSIRRLLVLKTNIPERPRYDVAEYVVQQGDSVFGIAKEYNVTPETVLWANYDTLNDNPHAIKVGVALKIPPVNGVYYQWQEGDTLESVATTLKSSPEAILDWIGNGLDLTNPTIEPGQYVMVPDGKREFKQWIIPTIARGKSGTANTGGSACSGGAVGGGGFIWPTASHVLSGNDYWSGHLGIDIAGVTGAPVYAADAGVVTLAAGGWNGGYGNVVQIDHGNGYSTLYGHLSSINVSTCQSVGAGTVIGAVGNTGNSFGSHLHFEVRQNGGFVNPWYVLPPP